MAVSKNNKPSSSRKTWRDILFFALSVFFAVALFKSSALEALIRLSEGFTLLGAFIAGALFTSVFTIPLALATFGEIAAYGSPWALALVAALGAAVADVLLLAFIKLRLSKIIVFALGAHRPWLERMLKYRTFRVAAPILGAFAIASPLPDEVGLSLFGLAQIRLSIIAPLVFILHFSGILAVLVAIRALV